MNYRIKILLYFVAAAGLILWLSGKPTQETPAPVTAPVNDVEVVQPVINTLIQSRAFSETGMIGIVHSDAQGFTASDEQVFFTTDAGNIYEITDDVADMHNGQQVRIHGTLVDADPTRTDDAPVIQLEYVEQLTAYDDAQAVVAGNEKWVNIACRFADMPDETPQPRQYFEDMMSNTEPGMDHYWRATSTGLVNIEGSAAYGWYDLPSDKAHYLRASILNVGIALQMIMRDCTEQAMSVDNVDLLQFGGINIMLNDTFGCCAWGGRMAIPIDGQNVSFRTTWLPPWAFNSLHVIAHEMGHGWGLPHSSGPYGQTYDSAWDVMSGGTRMLDFCRIGTEALGCHQVGTIGFHLEILGWIPQNRIVTVEPGTSATVTLTALTRVAGTSDTLLINIPVDQSANFYTVEVRHLYNYDTNLPDEAVVMHEVDPDRPSPAFVIDADNNGNPNDEGAMWRVGETFTDRSAGISMTVLSQTENTYTIRVTNMDN